MSLLKFGFKRTRKTSDDESHAAAEPANKRPNVSEQAEQPKELTGTLLCMARIIVSIH